MYIDGLSEQYTNLSMAYRHSRNNDVRFFVLFCLVYPQYEASWTISIVARSLEGQMTQYGCLWRKGTFRLTLVSSVTAVSVQDRRLLPPSAYIANLYPRYQTHALQDGCLSFDTVFASIVRVSASVIRIKVKRESAMRYCISAALHIPLFVRHKQLQGFQEAGGGSR